MKYVMKCIDNLRQKYLKPSAPWWAVVLGMPVLVLMEVEPTVSRELQPVFKPVVALGKFAHTIYRDTFPDNEAGFIMEMMFLLAAGWMALLMAIFLLSDW